MITLKKIKRPISRSFDFQRPEGARVDVLMCVLGLIGVLKCWLKD